MENTRQEKPAYLRWKCLDDFSNMNKSKIFFNGEYSPSVSTIETLKPIFEDIKKRYSKQIRDLFENDNQHVILAGGIYSFFFCLPKMLKFISDKYPLLPIRLVLHNINSLSELIKYDYDFVATVLYPGINEKAFKGINGTNYFKSKKSFEDKVFLAIGEQAASEYESIKKALDTHNILFGRLDEAGDKEYLYSVAPVGRERENPKVVVDSYFMVYLMMRQNAGIAMGMESMSYQEKENLLILKDRVLSRPNRFVVFKNRPKYLNYFSKVFFRIFERELC